jgi:hypothetical protein
MRVTVLDPDWGTTMVDPSRTMVVDEGIDCVWLASKGVAEADCGTETVRPSTTPVLVKLAMGIVSVPTTMSDGSTTAVVVPDGPMRVTVLEPDWGTTIVEPSRTRVVGWVAGWVWLEPDGLEPDRFVPDGLAPVGVAPEEVAPEEVAPDGLASEGLVSHGFAPDGLAVDGLAPDGLLPDEFVADELAADEFATGEPVPVDDAASGVVGLPFGVVVAVFTGCDPELADPVTVIKVEILRVSMELPAGAKAPEVSVVVKTAVRWDWVFVLDPDAVRSEKSEVCNVPVRLATVVTWKLVVDDVPALAELEDTKHGPCLQLVVKQHWSGSFNQSPGLTSTRGAFAVIKQAASIQ